MAKNKKQRKPVKKAIKKVVKKTKAIKRKPIKKVAPKKVVRRKLAKKPVKKVVAKKPVKFKRPIKKTLRPPVRKQQQPESFQKATMTKLPDGFVNISYTVPSSALRQLERDAKAPARAALLKKKLTKAKAAIKQSIRRTDYGKILYYYAATNKRVKNVWEINKRSKLWAVYIKSKGTFEILNPDDPRTINTTVPPVIGSSTLEDFNFKRIAKKDPDLYKKLIRSLREDVKKSAAYGRVIEHEYHYTTTTGELTNFYRRVMELFLKAKDLVGGQSQWIIHGTAFFKEFPEPINFTTDPIKSFWFFKWQGFKKKTRFAYTRGTRIVGGREVPDYQPMLDMVSLISHSGLARTLETYGLVTSSSMKRVRAINKGYAKKEWVNNSGELWGGIGAESSTVTDIFYRIELIL